MGRPPRLSTDEILDRALPVFWRRGFAAATLEELETATGLGRQCLYNQFADKQGLYRAAVRHYGDRFAGIMAPLRAADADLGTLLRFFAAGRQRMRAAHCGGCLFARLAAEPLDDPEVAAIVAEGTRVVRAAITAIVAREINAGRIRDPRPPEQLADFLWALNAGTASLGFTDDGDAAAANALRLAVDLLTGNAIPADAAT
jgi:AcrR family transcriptional regulator